MKKRLPNANIGILDGVARSAKAVRVHLALFLSDIPGYETAHLCAIGLPLGCELRRNKNVSDRNFGCYGIFMFRTVISDVSGTELIEKLPRKGGSSQIPNSKSKK